MGRKQQKKSDICNIARLKKTQTANSSAKVMGVRMQTMYSGPIPPAIELEKFEKVLPGAADRILSMAENQSAHRQKMEKTALNAQINAERLGQIFGLVIFLVAVIGGVVLIAFNKDVFGISAIIASLGSIVWLHYKDSKDKKEELKQKKQTEE